MVPPHSRDPATHFQKEANSMTYQTPAKAAAIAALLGSSAFAQAPDLRGDIGLDSGAALPEGRIAIYLKDPATGPSGMEAADLYIQSSGKTDRIAFTLAPDEDWDLTSPSLQIVARLEREDGWLLARGSARPEAGSQIHITLYEAMYR
ncbi:hypothetical protein AAD018_009670 [Aestuariibius insulae]|uniref:hypothetical protein n=1 Tax=Aestuariibius insulae TaxID=2058287 RepID=UPI00345E7A98